jgi:hypothetical protein
MNRALIRDLAAPVLPAMTMLLAAVAAPAQQVAESFKTGFGWSPGMRIQATETRIGVIREGAVSDSGRVSAAAYTIVVSEHDDGLLISHEDIRVERFGDFPDGLPAITKVNTVVADNLKYWMRLPSLVVTREGEFVRVDDLEAFRFRVDSSIRPVAAALAGHDPEIAALLDELLEVVVNEQVIEDLASDRWTSLVDLWTNTDWRVGSVSVAETEAPNPLVPGPPITYTVNAGVIGKVDCQAPLGGTTCASFVMVARPADAALGQAARMLADSLGAQLLAAAGQDASQEYERAGADALTFEELNLQTRVELLAHPVSMLPVYLEERQTRSGKGVGLGEPFSFHTEEILTTEFTYPGGP